MTLEEMKAKFAGRYVQHGGFHGSDPASPIAKVWRITTQGIWVTIPNGERQQWHPRTATSASPPPRAPSPSTDHHLPNPHPRKGHHHDRNNT